VRTEMIIIISFGFFDLYLFEKTNYVISQLPNGLKRRSVVARLLGLRIRIPPVAWFFSCECCVLSGRGLCDGPVTGSEESY
jgi:hypothetical protein